MRGHSNVVQEVQWCLGVHESIDDSRLLKLAAVVTSRRLGMMTLPKGNGNPSLSLPCPKTVKLCRLMNVALINGSLLRAVPLVSLFRPFANMSQ